MECHMEKKGRNRLWLLVVMEKTVAAGGRGGEGDHRSPEIGGDPLPSPTTGEEGAGERGGGCVGRKSWKKGYAGCAWATEGPIVADKNCEKIHYMAPNIYCCGAGTAADTEAVTDMVSSQLQLHHYVTGRESRVITALTLLKSHLFSYQGFVSAALVLGGVDVTGPHLHTVYPHGSTDTLPFATMGSGSLAAMAVFESNFKEGLTRDEGIKLVSEAICSGIFNDLGSGSNVDVCVITKGHTEYLRNHLLPNPRTYVSSRGYSFIKGHTEVLTTKITPLKSKALATEVDAMEE